MPSNSAIVSSAPPRAVPISREVSTGWQALAARFVGFLLLLVVLEALFAVPKLTWDLAVADRALLGILLGLAVAAAAAGLLWLGRHRLAAGLEKIGVRLAAIPRRRWLILLIVGGIAARIAWALLFPSPFTSDGWSYFDLAQRMAQGLTYQTPQGEWAIWPPGYPFLLLTFFQIVGISPWAVTAANLLLFVGTVLVVHALAFRMAGEAAARIATLLIAVWPNLIASAGVANKEGVIVFLLPAAILLYLVAGSSRSKASAVALRLAAGLVLGYSLLTQPAVMLVVFAFPIWELLLRVPLFRIAGRFALLLLGMAIVVLPWSFRNQRVLGRFVLVSTNGGSVFYRANNPLATGGWIAHGERRLTGDELTQDRLGYQWGKEWILENPGPFLQLALRKQILFLGDDAMGIYDGLKRGLKMNGPIYAGAKLVANAYWWGIWALVLLALLVRPGWTRHPLALLFALVALYFWGIDSVFESGARHHMPLVGLLAVMAGWGAGGGMLPADERRRDLGLLS